MCRIYKSKVKVINYIMIILLSKYLQLIKIRTQITQPMLALKQKMDKIQNYLFPEQHSINVHHSIINTDTLFYIRLVALIYLTAIYIWSMVITQSALTNVIYLTMQGYFLTWLYFLLTFQDYMVNGLGRWGRVLPLCNNLKYYIEILYQMAFCVELPITIVFWAFLFKIVLGMEGVTLQVIIVNANLHSVPLLALSIDMIYNTFKFPSQHFLIILVFSFQYMIVNLSYSLGAHIIYKPIDWVSPLSYILMAGAVVMAFLMHFLGRYIYNTCKKQRIQSQMTQGLIASNEKKQREENYQIQSSNKKLRRSDSNQQTNNMNVLAQQNRQGPRVSLITQNL